MYAYHHTSVRLGSAAALLGLLMGCASGGGAAPVFDPAGDYSAVVGRELRVEISATDADGDFVSFDFRTPSQGFSSNAELRSRADGSALIAWIPTAADVGELTVDLVASDGAHHTVESIHIEVRSAESRPPVIVEPRNAGTLFEPTGAEPCLTIEVQVQHHDEVEVIMTKQPEGATLVQDREGLGALWRWCPTDEERAAGGRHTVVFYATDGEQQSAPKSFIIMLDSDRVPPANCGGTPPVIAHEPADLPAANIRLEARIRDDEGVKQAYLCAGPPTAPPAELCKHAVPMTLGSGGPKDGRWAVELPNPRNFEDGQGIDAIAYVIVAEDADGPAGACTHKTTAPSTNERYTISLTDEASGTPYCTPCERDSECSTGMACVQYARSDGQSACVSTCSSSGADEECPGSVCSIYLHATADWDLVYECMPPGGAYYCDSVPPSTACTPDRYEDNDVRSKAAAINAETINAVLCPAGALDGEDDYYRFELSSPMLVDLQLRGPAAADLDLDLWGPTAADRWRSYGTDSNEQIMRCVPAGTYDTRVFSVRNQPASGTSYTLDLAVAPCSCIPDNAEPDNNDADARLVLDVRGGHSETAQTICADDADWYYLGLLAQGRSIHTELAFAQASRDRDLDIELWVADESGSVELLFPCLSSPGNDCSGNNGQSGTPNESFVWNVDRLGEYFIVVKGFNGSTNTYDICIGDSASTCPSP